MSYRQKKKHTHSKYHPINSRFFCFGKSLKLLNQFKLKATKTMEGATRSQASSELRLLTHIYSFLAEKINQGCSNLFTVWIWMIRIASTLRDIWNFITSLFHFAKTKSFKLIDFIFLILVYPILTFVLFGLKFIFCLCSYFFK